MKDFRNILLVSQGVGDETESLKQALTLAHNSGARLKMLVICPDIPGQFEEYKAKFENVLLLQLRDAVSKAQKMLGLSEEDVPVGFETESSNALVIRVIQRVLRDGHDLVIKQAETTEGGKGYRALDMALLRKCPCPVWLARPITRHRGEIRVAVAVDPENEQPAGHELSLRLLRTSRALADTCSDGLDVVSCWDFEFENYLSQSLFLNMTEEKIADIVSSAENDHKTALENVVRESGIGGKIRIHHPRGRPDQALSLFAESEKIDILVMGTVARTGIPGFTMGNTAENIMQKVGCSLLALKPPGFVSPVRLF